MVDSIEDEDDFASNDDQVEEDEDEPWFSMGMTRAEKVEARRPWRLSVIIKLIV